MIKKILLSLIFQISFGYIITAQNISNINVNNLSDSQIQKIIQEAESIGLTFEQAISLAESRGATPTQISNFKGRVGNTEKVNNQLLVAGDEKNTNASSLSTNSFSDKEEFTVSEKNKKIFGFNLFNNKNLSFEPSVNIPKPKNYIIGNGDELLINIWGASQQTYQSVVDQNGAIHIKDLGPIYISGMNFDNAKSSIKKRLTAIYSGMGGDKPNTWSDVSLSNLRAIKINITGEVCVPGTYNLPATATAFNALYLSGGPNENGSFRDIKLIRDGKIIEHIDVYDFLINSNSNGNIQLRDQDILFVPTYNVRVEINGAFKRNNYFELLDNERLSDLIYFAGDFSDDAYQSRISITRLTDKEKSIIDVEKPDFSSFKLKSGDVVFTGTIIDRFQNRVSIKGAVYRPGMFELTKDLTLLDLIKKAEGVKEEAYLNRGHIIREKENRMTELISFNIDSVLLGKTNHKLKREDIIQISDVFSMQQEKFVDIVGEVQNPGQFQYHNNMTLKDLIYIAGGFNEAASESYIEISRRHNYNKAAKQTSEMVEIYSININRELQLQTEDESFLISPFDKIYVRRAPSYFKQQTVSVNGEVLYPGSYSIKSKTERVSDLITRSGGITNYAYLEGATLERDYKIRGIDFEEIQNNNATNDSNQIISAIQKSQFNLLELNLTEILKTPGSVYDFLLKEGDIINIPIKSEEVRVIGEVMNPVGLVYEKGRNVRFYIDKTGGFKQNAKKSKVYVLYANGTTKTTNNNIIFKDFPPIEPGCKIIVPAKPEKTGADNSAKALAYASTIASLAIAIATIFR